LPPASLLLDEKEITAHRRRSERQSGAGERGELNAPTIRRTIGSPSRRGPRLIPAGLRLDDSGDSGNDDMTNFCLRADANNQSVMVTDRNGVIEYVNPAFERLTGYAHSEAVGQPARLLNSGLHKADFFAELWQTLIDGREFHALFANRRRNGDIFHEEKTLRPFVDRFGHASHFVAVGQPVPEFLQSTLARPEHLPNHDALTGLPNRNIFLDRLNQHCARAARRGGKFALAFVDLDEFKEINDCLGHHAGDLALRTMAKRLQECMRDEDTVARLGGDEFAIILNEVDDHEKIMRILEKLLVSLAKGFPVAGRNVPIRASIGVSVFGQDGRSGEAMLRLADRAMYASKKRGGNQVHIQAGGGGGDGRGRAAPDDAEEVTGVTGVDPPQGEGKREAEAEPPSPHAVCPPLPAGASPETFAFAAKALNSGASRSDRLDS
jgi:diguanylate cyclase (GGDEF)-like protein/PAS domain S-box-containing protein